MVRIPDHYNANGTVYLRKLRDIHLTRGWRNKEQRNKNRETPEERTAQKNEQNYITGSLLGQSPEGKD